MEEGSSAGTSSSKFLTPASVEVTLESNHVRNESSHIMKSTIIGKVEKSITYVWKLGIHESKENTCM